MDGALSVVPNMPTMAPMSLLPIPPLETATEPVFSAADVRERWRALMGDLGFSERLLKFVFVGPDRRFTKVLIDVEVGPHPRAAQLDKVMSAIATLQQENFGGDHTVAVLLTRPGRGGLSNNDRRWATELQAAAARFGIGLEPIFRANDELIVAV